jgi:hypothetical protein
MGRRRGDLGKLPFWDSSRRLGKGAGNEALRTAGGCERGYADVVDTLALCR